MARDATAVASSARSTSAAGKTVHFTGPQSIRIDTPVFIRSLAEVLWFLIAIAGVEAIDILRSHGMIRSLLSWY